MKLSEEVRAGDYPVWADKIAELEQELLEERASYEAERQRLRDVLITYSHNGRLVSVEDRGRFRQSARQALEVGG